jgi:hypothetical protein
LDEGDVSGEIEGGWPAKAVEVETAHFLEVRHAEGDDVNARIHKLKLTLPDTTPARVVGGVPE